MSLRAIRAFSSRSRILGVWAEALRPSALKIADESIRNGLFKGLPTQGPPSIVEPAAKSAYHSPEYIDEAFSGAYEILEQNAEEQYRKIEEKKSQMSPVELEAATAAAEELNPEVLYKTRFELASLDRSQPVYRKFLQKKWIDHDLMVTMQRLEQLHVIPDTMPTLGPKVDVRVKFGHNDEAEFGDWVVPGTILPAFAVSQPPTIDIQQFETAPKSSDLFTVVLVNPDTPDVARNTYKTTLNYGLRNVPLTFTDSTITPGKLLSNPLWIFKAYEPLVPEKNIPTLRACLWVFRQNGELGDLKFDGANFDIRAFADKNELTAVGAHVWRQAFDRSVAGVRAAYGLRLGRVFNPIRGSEPL